MLGRKLSSIRSTTGSLWVAYGVLQKDIVIILANAISLALIGGLVCLKLLHTSS